MKLPNRIFGIDTKEAYERYLAEAEKQKDKNPQITNQNLITPANIQDPETYIILPGKTHDSYSYPDILVSTGKSYHGQNWNQAQETLHKNNEFMLTVRQFADFLNLLRSGQAYDGAGSKLSKQKLDQILDEILTVKDPWRSEWLDTKFTVSGKEYNVTYHKINPDGTLRQVAEPLEECLMEDKTPGIDLEYWLNNATSQGLPPKSTPKGDIYYWYPRNRHVVRFGANSYGVYLGCYGGPLDSDATLGVRFARVK